MRRLALAAAALLLAGRAGAALTERLTRSKPASVGGGSESIEVMSGQVFAKLAPTADKNAIAAAVGGSVLRDNPSVGWTLFSISSGMPVNTAVSIIAGQSGVISVDGNRAYRLHNTATDPGVASQYGLQRINAFAAWDSETGSTNKVTVAMIDAGIDGTNQPDVDGKLVGTSQYFNPFNFGAGHQSNDTPIAACVHGTRTSSVAAASANNGAGIAGVSWGAKLISLRVFSATDCNSNCTDATANGCGTNDQTIIDAVNYVRTVMVPASATFGRVVINMSIGGAASCSAAMQTALSNAVAAGVPIVISAGNGGGAVESPANCATSTGGTGIIPVGASDSNDQIAYFSSRGPELAANGVLAPGVNVLTDDAGSPVGTGGTVTDSGTSFSAPHVAGVAALLLSAKPALTAQQVQSMIIAGGDNTGLSTQSTSTSGDGVRLDAARSLRLATTGSAGNSDLDTKSIAYPNPFRPSQASYVTFSIPKGTTSNTRTLNVYSSAGEHVRSVAGLTWDGKNDAGAIVASGTYLYVIKIGDSQTFRGRVAVIR